jgi:glutaredoxin
MFCNRTKEFLRANNVPFTDRDITADESAMADLAKLGAMTTPITVIDGQPVIGNDVWKTVTGFGGTQRRWRASIRPSRRALTPIPVSA